MSDWIPYASMPPEMKDGRMVWLSGDGVGVYPMRWNPRGYNIIFSRDKVGIWELIGGGMTWTDERPEGAPDFWRPATAQEIVEAERDRRGSPSYGRVAIPNAPEDQG